MCSLITIVSLSITNRFFRIHTICLRFVILGDLFMFILHADTFHVCQSSKKKKKKRKGKSIIIVIRAEGTSVAVLNELGKHESTGLLVKAQL
jgi:hypothetical protein